MDKNPTFSTLPDGMVRMEHGEQVTHYKAVGATIYVMPSEGPRTILMVGGARNPERLRDGETLEDAVRRLHAPPEQGIPLGFWLGLMLALVALGGLLVWLKAPFGGGW